MMEQIAKKEGFELRNIKNLGKRNIVRNITLDGKPAILKIYRNKYFPKQGEYEAMVIKSLTPHINLASIIKTDSFNGIKYNIFETISGYTLYEKQYLGYELDMAKYLEKLHLLHPVINTSLAQNDKESIMKKVINRVPKKIAKLYHNNRPIGTPGFTHNDPHFRHTLVSGGRLYLIDWEDAQYGYIETDYASFIKDQIETGRPTKEIYSFVNACSGIEKTLLPFMGKLYMIDLVFNHGINSSNKKEMEEYIEIFFKSNSIYKAIDEICNDN